MTSSVVQVRCESFNGQEVRNLATFAELVDTCTDKYMKFGLEGGKSVILDRLQANEDAPRILQQHAITFDRSADLRCVLPCIHRLHGVLCVLPLWQGVVCHSGAL